MSRQSGRFSWLAGAGGGDGAGVLQLTMANRVPDNGVRYLRVGDVATSAAPVVLDSGVTVTGLSLSVDVADGSRTYDLEVLRNGSIVGTLTLPLSTKSITASSLAISMAGGDEIAARIRRISGSGPSSYRRVFAGLALEEA